MCDWFAWIILEKSKWTRKATQPYSEHEPKMLREVSVNKEKLKNQYETMKMAEGINYIVLHECIIVKGGAQQVDDINEVDESIHVN